MEWILKCRGRDLEISVSDGWLAVAVRLVEGTNAGKVLSAVDPYGDATLDPSKVVLLRNAVGDVALAMRALPQRDKREKRCRGRGGVRGAVSVSAEDREVAEAAFAFLEEAVKSRQPVMIVGD